MIADSHCHLDYSHLFDQLNDVVKRAQSNQVKYLLTICTTLESFERIELIINRYINIYGTFGIHPHESTKYKNVDLKFIVDQKKKNNVKLFDRKSKVKRAQQENIEKNIKSKL